MLPPCSQRSLGTHTTLDTVASHLFISKGLCTLDEFVSDDCCVSATLSDHEGV